MFKSIATFLTSLGPFDAFGVLAFFVLWILAIIGWWMNIYKLFVHLPLFDIETVVRLIGLFPAAGAIVGWF